MHDPEAADAQAEIRLREDRFALMWAVVGCTKDEEIAQEAGYSARTVRRARTGQLGNAFVAQTIHALRRHADKLARYGLTPTLDELFEVVEARASEKAA